MSGHDLWARIRGWVRQNARQERPSAPTTFNPPNPPLELQEPRISYSFMSSSPFAQAWYKTRELGEHDRAASLHDLYTRRRWPGGAFPDPRGAAAFSNRAVIGAAAKRAGVRIWPVPDEKRAPESHTRDAAHLTPDAWLITYQQRATTHKMATIAVTTHDSELLMLWRVALLLGLIAREPERVRDPHAPDGVTILPNDPVIIALCHRYAKALLNITCECSTFFGCACMDIEQRLNLTTRRPRAAHDLDSRTANQRAIERPRSRRPARAPRG